MTENQTLREALQAIANIDDATNHSVDASAALDRIGQIARQALALPPDVPETTFRGMREALQLIAWSNDSKWQADCARQAIAMPTADHLPDAGEMVVDHFPDATKMIETAEPVGDREAFEREMRCEEEWGHRSLKKRQNGQYENWQADLMWAVWQARAALAGDAAVLAEREACAKLCEEVADDLITAMRKEGETDDEVMTSLVAPARVCAEEIRGGYSKKFNPHNAAVDAAMRKDKP